MSAYKPYLKYKSSGVEWLGDVPVTWTVSRIKNVATINASKSEVSHLDPETEVSFLPMEAVGDDGSLDISSTRQLGDVLTGYTYVRENDVLVAKITPCFENGKGCIARGLIQGIGFATTEVVPIRPNKHSIPEFLYFLLHGLPFRKVAEGSMYGAGGQKRVSDTFVAGYSFALPPLPEQIQIATFLDRECGKLDALQAKQERLIELLKEKRQALISHAVTHGLDPAAKLKSSGIEWLGEVPEHWRTLKLGHVCKLQGGFAFKADEFGDEGIPVIRMKNLSRGNLDMDEVARVPVTSTNSSVALRAGDLLWGMSGSVGDTGSLGNYAVVFAEDLPAQLNQRVGRFLPDTSKLLNEFLCRAIQASSFYEQILLEVTGTAQFNVSSSQVESCYIALPPLTEQRAIVEHLDEKCGKIDQLKAKAERAIELLKERRSALISAAVTGKIDVRGK